MKKNKGLLMAAVFAVIAAVGLATAAFNPYAATRFYSMWLDDLRVATVSHGDQALTANITLPSSSNARYQTTLPVYNPTASSIPAGSVLIASTTGAGYVNIAPATINQTNIIGVAAETIAATSKGFMVPRGGGFALVLTTGTVAVGDVLVTSGTVAGRMGTANSPTSGADTAVAMTAGVAAGSTVLAVMR